MKALKTNKELYGAVRGRLIAPDRLVYEDNGKLIELQLTGNVVETEYNDITAIGQLQGNTFIVKQMESAVPEYGLQFLSFEEHNCYVTIIPVSNIESADEKIGKSGEHYTAVVAKDNTVLKNGTIYVTIFKEFFKTEDVLVLLSGKAPEMKIDEFGKGYAIKRVTTVSLSGVQI